MKTKRIIALLLLLVMLFALAACGGRKPSVVGLWEAEVDMRDQMVEQLDASVGGSKSFGDYLDSFVWVLTLELKENGTYTLGYKNYPKSSFSEWMDVENWHVYGLIWEPERLVWTVDGNEVGRYEKSTIQYYLDNGQWPFDHAFYLILNQSVGNGSWAANADTEYTYETHFDYVRVYQKATSGIDNLRREGSASQKLFDLQGREVGSVQDISADTSTLPKGIYMVNHRKFVVK